MAATQPNRQAQPVQLSPYGTLYSFTTVTEAPEGYDEQAPYIVGLVQLDDGVMVSAQITDVDGALAIGDRVEMVTRKLTTEGVRGMIVYGYKFRPVLVTAQ
ncbi:MAG: OB-fold domain-containing protein [Anaerolineae bacterium]|jgi:hypothetical protein|nr:OB-fold domain-containing protein [Anaerolineae bacterium]